MDSVSHPGSPCPFEGAAPGSIKLRWHDRTCARSPMAMVKLRWGKTAGQEPVEASPRAGGCGTTA
ncbi:hypothetical protein GCM10010405_34170 [Streptomyces macrosporus]|uniref:Uncharacterized protein n=1 Tax=Streptomyces macrosporus TaxID=44032 RepID=A0ABP5XEG1_9ACTN